MQNYSNVKLSSLVNREHDEKFSATGVVVDCESFSPPENLVEISLRLVIDEDGIINDDLIDTIISYTLANVGVTLEIPFEIDIENTSYYLSLASNAGFSLSILPPNDISDQTLESYTKRLEAFTNSFLEQKNFSGEVLPITSYFQYMYLEQVVDVSDFVASDKYMVSTFVDILSEEQSDYFKSKIRKIIIDHFEGEENFKHFSKAIVHKLFTTIEAQCQEISSNQSPK